MDDFTYLEFKYEVTLICMKFHISGVNNMKNPLPLSSPDLNINRKGKKK